MGTEPKKGIGQGRRSNPVGGGLMRSAGGWSALKALRPIGAYRKGLRFRNLLNSTYRQTSASRKVANDTDMVKK